MSLTAFVVRPVCLVISEIAEWILKRLKTEDYFEVLRVNMLIRVARRKLLFTYQTRQICVPIVYPIIEMCFHLTRTCRGDIARDICRFAQPRLY